MKSLPLLAVVLALSACVPPTFDPATCDEGVTVGDCAPDVAGQDRDGNEVALSDFQDEALIVVFGEMWCPLCQILATELEPLWEDHGDKDLTVVMVLDQDFNGNSASPEEATTFAEEFELTFPVIVTEETLAEDYEYGVQRPRAFVLDDDLLIRHRSAGYRPGTFEDLRTEALALLPE
ncbi:MAG: TlpA family protein disulfide reductase [Proteobacteria bacterium]|nr:TlpA family protein disulfide reductase [Pseudomonadota bacterium]